MLPASDRRPTLLSADLEAARLSLTNIVLQDVSADSALVDAVQHGGPPASQLGRLRRLSRPERTRITEHNAQKLLNRRLRGLCT